MDTYDEFKTRYLHHLGDPDRPNGYTAYCRAEADHVARHGGRRYANHKTFRNTMSRHDTQRRQATTTTPTTGTGLVPINCQICDTELHRVPRNDLRTIIPHFCEDCRTELKKLILV